MDTVVKRGSFFTFKAFIMENIYSNLPLEEGRGNRSLAKVRMLVHCDANGHGIVTILR